MHSGIQEFRIPECMCVQTPPDYMYKDNTPIHTIRGGSTHTCIHEFMNSGIPGFLYALVCTIRGGSVHTCIQEFRISGIQGSCIHSY